MVRLGIQTGVFLLFSRYLSLTELGVYSFAYAFVQLTQTFVRTGVMETVVASQRHDRDYLVSAMAVSVSIGMLAALVLVVAGAVSAFFNSPSGVMLWALAIIPVLDSIGIVPEAILRRKLEFSSITIRTTIGLVIAAAVCLAAGYWGWGAWALVVFNVVASIVSLATALYIVRHEMPYGLGNKADMMAVAGPSFHVSISTFASGAIVPASQIALGSFSGPAAVGAYAIAQRVLALINSVAVDPVRVSALPVLSRVKSEEERRRALLEVLSMCGTLLSAIYLGVSAISPVLLPLVIGRNGNEAYPILWVLSFHFVALVISMITTQILLVCGQSRQVLNFTLVQSAAGVVMALIAAPFGAVAVAAAYVVRAYAIMPLVFRQAWKHGGIHYSSYIKALAAPVVAGLIMQVAVTETMHLMTGYGMARVMIVGVGLVVGAIVYPMALLVFGRRHLIGAIKLVNALFGH
jgi:PST family polysaccharide transporter